MKTNAPIILSELRHRYGKNQALHETSLTIPAGKMVGLIGPDGVGKSTLLGLIAGARKIQHGSIMVFNGDIRNQHFRNTISPRIAFMPQGLGKNLYATLSVFENINFFGRLFGIKTTQRHRQIKRLVEATGLAPFQDRQAGKLSGGMKQKLGLCCALIHDPDLLILDEPTTGVDPLSRRQFWELVKQIRDRRPGMSILIATAYMDEAEGFDWLIPMNDGKVLQTGTSAELKQLTTTETLEAAFIALLLHNKGYKKRALTIPPLQGKTDKIAISAQGLSKNFGHFTAVDKVDLEIRQGEIFGFLGSNGCGKTTTMKMLTGLLPATSGSARLFDNPVQADSMATKHRVGYMSQGFSLYEELTVMQNLHLHARLFNLQEDDARQRINSLLQRFNLVSYADENAGTLPLGIRQRLSLAVAVIHTPDLLILDEPTSGVDPIARDSFWELLIELSRNQGVTIFISTHFMNEAERCDRISLMHAGRVLVTDAPVAIRRSRGTSNMEDAFIAYLEDEQDPEIPSPQNTQLSGQRIESTHNNTFDIRRLLGYSIRESLEILRDPVLLAFALLGSALLMLVLGYGISLDVENLTFAVLDRDQSPLSRDYIQNIAGSRYFIERPPLYSEEELDKRMRSGELSLALEIQPGFSAALKRGRMAEIGVWIDGAMPFRAETINGYVQGMHLSYLTDLAKRKTGEDITLLPATLQPRYRYNQDFKSIHAIVPAVIPLLMMFIPAILTALSVVREKELGSIVNLHVSPSCRLEFLLGKQMPYIALSMAGFLCLILVAVFVFSVPLKGDIFFLCLTGLLYVSASTGFGLLLSSFTRTQIAALAGTAIITLLATVNFSGMTEPVSSLEGMGRLIGDNWPASSFIIIVRGVFTKGLGYGDLAREFRHLVIFAPAFTLLSLLLLEKQEK